MSENQTFHLNDKTRNRLEWLAKQNDTTVSGMTQKILDEYFADHAVEESMVADLFQTTLKMLQAGTDQDDSDPFPPAK